MQSDRLKAEPLLFLKRYAIFQRANKNLVDLHSSDVSKAHGEWKLSQVRVFPADYEIGLEIGATHLIALRKATPVVWVNLPED